MASIIVDLNSEDASAVGTPDDFTVDLDPPIMLNRYQLHTVRLYRAKFWNSIYNVSDALANNVLRYHNGAEWKTLTYPDGIYTLSDLYTRLQVFMASEGDWNATAETYYITIAADYNRLRTSVTLENSYQLDLTAATSAYHELLGFNSQTLSGDGTYLGEGRLQLDGGVAALRINCSLAKAGGGYGGYADGSGASLLWVVNRPVIPAAMITVGGPSEAAGLVPPPVPLGGDREITSVRMWIRDNQGRAVSFNNEPVSYTLVIQPVNKEPAPIVP